MWLFPCSLQEDLNTGRKEKLHRYSLIIALVFLEIMLTCFLHFYKVVPHASLQPQNIKFQKMLHWNRTLRQMKFPIHLHSQDSCLKTLIGHGEKREWMPIECLLTGTYQLWHTYIHKQNHKEWMNEWMDGLMNKVLTLQRIRWDTWRLSGKESSSSSRIHYVW